MKLLPFTDNIIIQQRLMQKSTSSLIISSAAAPARYAEVMEVGPDVADVVVGDQLIVNWDAVFLVSDDGVDRIASIKSKDVIAKIDKTVV